jgi:LAO/AO transport system kinase
MKKFNYKDIFINKHVAISRAISMVENNDSQVAKFYDKIYKYSNEPVRIGVTGPPGAGKSTLVDKLISYFINDNKSVGVVAIDPSSPFSGGALLGDRVRMSKYSENNNVYIRSMGNRGDLGGLSRKAQEVGDILAASGKDIIIFETVGVGQAEHDIVNAADFTIVVLVPESGDEVQLMKAGIIEIADLFVINKSDRPGSKRIERTLVDILHAVSTEDGYIPNVMSSVATTGDGVKQIFDKILSNIQLFEENGLLEKRRLSRYKNRIKALVTEKLEGIFWDLNRRRLFKNTTSSIDSIENPPNSVVRKLLLNFDKEVK